MGKPPAGQSAIERLLVEVEVLQEKIVRLREVLGDPAEVDAIIEEVRAVADRLLRRHLEHSASDLAASTSQAEAHDVLLQAVESAAADFSAYAAGLDFQAMAARANRRVN